MTGSDTAGPRVGKTICERTSLLPRSCVLSGHLAAVGVSLLTCGSPATGKGSVDDTPGCRAELQQRVQQRGPNEPVPGRTMTDAGGLWPAQTAQPRTIVNPAN